MIFRPLLLHRDFYDTVFWVPNLRKASQKIPGRRYKLSHKDGLISIQRNIFDELLFFQLNETSTRFCIAKGRIMWSGNKASIDLKIGLNTYVLVSYLINIAFLGFFSVYGFLMDWNTGLLFLLMAIVFGTILYFQSKNAVSRFYAGLAQDIEYFRINDSTRYWMED